MPCLSKQCRSRSVGWIKESDWLTIRTGRGILIYSAWQGLKLSNSCLSNNTQYYEIRGVHAACSGHSFSAYHTPIRSVQYTNGQPSSDETLKVFLSYIIHSLIFSEFDTCVWFFLPFLTRETNFVFLCTYPFCKGVCPNLLFWREQN